MGGEERARQGGVVAEEEGQHLGVAHHVERHAAEAGGGDFGVEGDFGAHAAGEFHAAYQRPKTP